MAISNAASASAFDQAQGIIRRLYESRLTGYRGVARPSSVEVARALQRNNPLAVGVNYGDYRLIAARALKSWDAAIALGNDPTARPRIADIPVQYSLLPTSDRIQYRVAFTLDRPGGEQFRLTSFITSDRPLSLEQVRDTVLAGVDVSGGCAQIVSRRIVSGERGSVVSNVAVLSVQRSY